MAFLWGKVIDMLSGVWQMNSIIWKPSSYQVVSDSSCQVYWLLKGHFTAHAASDIYSQVKPDVRNSTVEVLGLSYYNYVLYMLEKYFYPLELLPNYSKINAKFSHLWEVSFTRLFFNSEEKLKLG